MAVKVYLSINNNEEVLLLPVSPSEYGEEHTWNNQDLSGLYQPLNIIQYKGLTKLEISSFFPVRDYPFLLNRNMWGMDYVNTILRWQKRRLPLRLIITNDDNSIKAANTNIAVTIDDFSFRTGKDGDIYYTLTLKEFAFVEVR